MIADFSPCTKIDLETGVRNTLVQWQEPLRHSLVERVCNFLERYPMTQAIGEDVMVRASIEATAVRRAE